MLTVPIRACLRTMESRDIPAGMRLVEAAGWNQTEADWRRFLALNPEGCFVAEIGGEVHGTTATIVYEDTLAWIGMVLVSPEHRGKGLGKQLFAAALEHLDGRKPLTVKLDATPQGQPLYQKFGFAPEYEIERWALEPALGRREPRDGLLTAPAGPLEPAQLDKIISAEARALGAERAALLRSLHEEAPEFTRTVCAGDALTGFTLGRRGRRADQLGPWLADDPETARLLLCSFMDASAGSPILVDCIKTQAGAREMLREAGFKFSRPLLRMARGPGLRPEPPLSLYAILGPEFG